MTSTGHAVFVLSAASGPLFYYRRRMEGLLWLSVTTTIVYALLVSTGLVIRLGRPQDPEYGPSAAMSA